MNKLVTMLKVSVQYLVLAAWASFLPLAAQADFDGSPEDRGGSVFHAAAQLGGVYTDNFFYSPSPNRNVLGLMLAPELVYGYSLSRFRFTAMGSAELATFNQPGNEDDYVDGKTKIGAEWQSAERHRFIYNADVQFSHDPYGTERTAGLATQNATLDRWRKYGTDIKYYYGLPADGFNLESAFNAVRKQYTTNEAITQFLDYGSVLGDLTFLYNYSPKTALLFDVSAVRTAFEQQASSGLDSTALHYLVGGRWTPTSKTNADIRVGYSTRRLRDSQRSQFSSLDWRASFRWGATASRAFLIKTERISQESYSANLFSFVDNRTASVAWTEDWSPLISTSAEVAYVQSRFIGAPRVDNSYAAKLGGEYRATQYATLLANLGYGRRQSNLTGLDYNRFDSYIGIKFSR